MIMIILKTYCCWIIYSCFTILATQVTCEEFSQCYHDVNICLWTDGSELSQSAAQTACQQRNGSFLPRITNDSIQSKLAEFRNASDNLLLGRGFWIDVRAVGINNWHWIDDSPLADGAYVYDQTDFTRFAVIEYNNYLKQFVNSARLWNNYQVSSYICQLQRGASCAAGDLSINSKCYRKFHNSSQLTWYSASNDCLSRGGSLAVFTDVERPSDNRQRTDWLNATGTYWIGLIRSWWNTTNEDGRAVDVQYSNWENGHPNTGYCVVVTRTNHWNTAEKCNIRQKYVCQNYTGHTTPIITTTTTTTTTPSLNVRSTTAAARSFSTSTTTSLSSASKTCSDVTTAVAIGVSVPCICITICVVAIVLYKCYSNRRREQSESANNYVELNTPRQREQPQYEELDQRHTQRHNGRHQSNNYENAAAAQ